MSDRPPTTPPIVDLSIAGTSLAFAADDSSDRPVLADDDRYERGARIGGGGMGDVWIARDRRLDRDVAIKEARPGADTQLLGEARRTASLDHPAIVAVHDTGTTQDGRPFYAMRLVRGVTLSMAIARADGLEGRLKLLKHVLDTALALAWAHARGQLHLDVKPANVMVGEFGETQVVDWGLGGVSPGLVAGTPAYMSPEQAWAGEVDARTDVWGLGGVLYAVLTGHPPRMGGLETALLAARGVVPPVRSLTPDAPPELCAIADRAMQADPAQRYESARAVADDLTRYMAGDRIIAHQYTTAELLGRFVRMWRGPLAAGALATLALILGVTVFTVRLSTERNRAVRAESATSEALATSTANYRQAVLVQALAAARLNRWPDARVLATQMLQGGESPEARGVLIAAAAYGSARKVAEIPLSENCLVLALVPGGAWCADGTEVFDVAGHHIPSDATAIVPVGKQLALVEPDVLRVVTADGSESRRLPFLGTTFVGFSSSDLGYVSVARTDRLGWVYSTTTGAYQVLEDCLGHGNASRVAFDTEGARRAVLCDDGALFVGRPEGPLALFATTEIVGDLDGGASALAFAGDRFVVGTNRGDLFVVSDHSTLWAAREAPGIVGLKTSTLNQMAVQRVDGPIEIWDIPSFSADSEPAAWIPVQNPRAARFEADGTLAVASAAAWTRWAIQPSPLVREYRGMAGVSTISIPEANMLLVGDGGGVVTSWDLAGGVPIFRFDTGGKAIKSAVFDEAGMLLIATGGVPGVSRFSRAGERFPTVYEDFAARRLLRLPGVTVALAYSPVPDRRVFSAEGELSSIACAHQEWRDGTSSHDGSRAVFVGTDGSIAPVYGNHCLPGPLVPGAVAADIADDGSLAVLDARELRTFDPTGHPQWTAPVIDGLDVAFSPGRSLIAVGSADGTARIYAAEGTLLAVIRGHQERVASVAFHPEGTSLFTASWDRTVRQWPLAPLRESPASLAASLATDGYPTVAEVLATPAW